MQLSSETRHFEALPRKRQLCAILKLQIDMMSVMPVVVNFRRLIAEKELDSTAVDGVCISQCVSQGLGSFSSCISCQVLNRDLLHAVVALYDQSLPDVTSDIIYSHVCRSASKTLLFIRDKEGRKWIHEFDDNLCVLVLCNEFLLIVWGYYVCIDDDYLYSVAARCLSDLFKHVMEVKTKIFYYQYQCVCSLACVASPSPFLFYLIN